MNLRKTSEYFVASEYEDFLKKRKRKNKLKKKRKRKNKKNEI